MNLFAHIPAVKIAGLHFQVCEVTPVLAADWLKRNRKNRKLKTPTLEAYARDMRNGDWYLTHQGIAFDDAGNLIDGQHRLEAIVRSKKSINLFVSAGWPSTIGKARTMDAVDRGANRSLADQLHLQHGLPLKEAGRVVQIANSIGAMASGGSRVRKSSTACVLAVFEAYAAEIKFVLANPIITRGVGSATVASVIVLARAAWPDKTDDFLTRLKTGENLIRGNAILELRNWLMGDGNREDAATIRSATCHHLQAFVEGRALSSLVCHSNVSLLHLLKLQGDRIGKLRTLFGAEAAAAAENKRATEAGQAETPGAKFNASATGPDALRVGATLSPIFSTTDLAARVDNVNVVGLWVAKWRSLGWTEPVGTREHRKLKEFGRV